MGVPGTELDARTESIIRQVQPAGFILFGRNIRQPQQLRDLIDHMRSLVNHEPIVTIDQEGGRVSRLKEFGSEPPSAKQLRDKGDLNLIRRHGELTGKLLRLFGFNLNLAPVLDASEDNEADNSLKNRTYGKTPEQVIPNARAFAEAMREQGILSCGKHFPGYSAAAVDPHHDLPVIRRSRQELAGSEWKPFIALQSLMDTMMVGHALYPGLDEPELASSLSPKIVKKILRDEWKYEGCIMTDDLDMGAIVNKYSVADSVKLGLEAGNDLILICHRVEAIPEAAEALGRTPESLLQPALERVEKLQKRLAPPHVFSLEAHQALDRQVYQLRVDTLGAEAAATRSVDDGKRSPVETF